jgi:hypothetical protein
VGSRPQRALIVGAPLRWATLAALTALVIAPTTARAHTTSTGLATLTVQGEALTWKLTLVLTELPDEPARLLAAAAAGDVDDAEHAVGALRPRLTLPAGDAVCRPGPARLQGSSVGDARVTVETTWRCLRPPRRLVFRDDSFDLLGPHHRTLVRIEGASVGQAALLPDAREVTLDLGSAGPQRTPGFFLLGVEHILTGFDHLLFLAGLLLGGGGPLTLLKIVTAFTIAHSVTLGAAVTGLVSVPSRVVEPAIAASIVYVALENVLRGGAVSRRWLVSFGFGLVHGLGFASALAPLNLPAWNLGLALFGFNLGVEAGQALVIAVVVPALLWARGRSWQPSVARALSLVVAFVGAVWFVQRLLVT